MTTQVADSFVNEEGALFLRRDGWQDFTPVITQNVNVTITVTTARVAIIAQTVIVNCLLAITGAGTVGNNIIITVPTFMRPINTGAIGTGYVFDATATGIFFGSLTAISGADIRIRIHALATATFVGVNPNFALANGDAISFQGAWER